MAGMEFASAAGLGLRVANFGSVGEVTVREPHQSTLINT